MLDEDCQMGMNAAGPSARPQMGATPYQDGEETGVTFRVWAPFAQQVNVAGEFNSWSGSSSPLYPEGDGFWSVDVPGAAVGQQYKFVIYNPADNALWRMDPYARSIIHTHDERDDLNGLIASSSAGYATPGYSTPAWNELVIYELHIGTFT